MKHPHWHYFVTLCEDMEHTVRFVEPAPDNFGTYSTEYARLYLAIGSEIDVVAKLLCTSVNPSASLNGINSYRKIILIKYPTLPEVEVTVPRSEISLMPWKEWLGDTNPNWWSLYNGVKHERNKHFKDANLENALSALAGLLVLLGYLYSDDLVH